MKKTAIILATLIFSGIAVAKDIGPDEAIKLKESGAILDFSKLNEIATNLYPGSKVESTELENENGQYVYEIDLVDSNGLKYDVHLDASNGTVLKNERD